MHPLSARTSFLAAVVLVALAAGTPVRAQDPVAALTLLRDKVTVIVHKDAGAREVQVVISGGAVTAIVDQKEVPKSRIVKKEGGTVQVLSDSGEELATVSTEGVRLSYPDNRLGGLVLVGQDPFNYTSLLARKATLGVHLGEVDETLAAHLHVRPDESILVLDVTEGGAAARAGLEQHDVITKIDGKSPASREKLGEVLATKKAGDTVTLGILRKGAATEVKAQLQEEDLKQGFHGLQPKRTATPYLLDAADAFKGYKALDFDKAGRWKVDRLQGLDVLKGHQEQPTVEKDTSDLKADLKDLREQLRQLDQVLKEMRAEKRKEH